MSLPQEPLGIRWVSFSLTSRYSFLHSLFRFVRRGFRHDFSLGRNAPLP
jgi:hypothetical protein